MLKTEYVQLETALSMLINQTINKMIESSESNSPLSR